MKRLAALILAVLLSVCGAALAQEPVTVTIFHTNDVHARVDEYIGYARLKTLVDEARAQGDTLLLDAGDALHGTSYATLERGESVLALMNAVGYDAMTPGNHDFDYGYERLKELEEKMTFPLLNANIALADGENAFLPYAVFVKSGRKIAVVGVANPALGKSIHPDCVRGLVFGGLGLIESAVNQAAREADAVIVLAHYGSAGKGAFTSADLAALPGVTLVIDGHSHTKLEDIAQVPGSAPVVSAGEHMKFLGKVTLELSSSGAKVVSVESLSAQELASIPPDPEIERMISLTRDTQLPVLRVVIGETTVDLDGERESNRSRETNLGNLAADAMRDCGRADFAFINGGGIRVSVPKGEITMGDAINIFPFGNSLVVLRVSGAALYEAMEYALTAYPALSGSFPQISGGSLAFDPALPAGARVLSFEIGGKPVSDDALYTVALCDYIALGGDGFTMFEDAETILSSDTLDQAFAAYVRKMGIVSPAVEGRVSVSE